MRPVSFTFPALPGVGTAQRWAGTELRARAQLPSLNTAQITALTLADSWLVVFGHVGGRLAGFSCYPELTLSRVSGETALPLSSQVG